MGYDGYNEHNASRTPRSRKRGHEAGSRKTEKTASALRVNPSSVQNTGRDIPPPGGWNIQQPRAAWSTSQRDSRKSSLQLDPSLEKGGRKRMSKTKRRIITMVLAECFALLFIFGYGFWARTWNMIQRVDDWVPEEIQNQNFSVDLPQYEKQKGHWGVYVFGVDSRGSNVGKDTHADVSIICDINHDTGEIRLVSVFRDSYLNINEKNDYNKINQAYFLGGPTDAAKALNKNLDLNITDYVTFSWKAVADGINLLGGVDMEISRAEFAYINSFITETVQATGVYSQHLKGPGLQHLDGVQAVAYGRLRLMDTDYARTERQRKVIKAAFEKAKAADITTLQQLALLLFPQVATSIDLEDIISLAGNVGKYYIGETGGFPFARGDANMGRKGACVIPQTLESNVIELHQFLYGQENYIPSDTVKQISTKISSDTGMYTKGISIDHVSTSGGSVPRPAKQQETEKPKETKTANKGDGEKQTEKEKEGSLEEESTEKTTEALEGTDASSSEETTGKKPSVPSVQTPTTQSGSQRPGSRPVSEPTAPPTSVLYPSEQNHPGSTAPTAPSSGTAAPSNGSAAPTQSAHPGTSTAPTQSAHPGASTAPTQSAHPGTSTAPTQSTHPGTSTTPTQSEHPGANSPSGSNLGPGGTAPSNGSTSGQNTPTVPAPPGNQNRETQQNSPGNNSPEAPSAASSGPTSVIIPDGQAISYEGPPGSEN